LKSEKAKRGILILMGTCAEGVRVQSGQVGLFVTNIRISAKDKVSFASGAARHDGVTYRGPAEEYIKRLTWRMQGVEEGWPLDLETGGRTADEPAVGFRYGVYRRSIMNDSFQN
jgi:hypothetical protein